MSKPSESIVKWIAQNQGYSFFTAPSATLQYYTDAFGIKRAMTYTGISDMERLKAYEVWRHEQADNHPEITFSKDFKIIRIHLIEKEYENRPES